MMPRYGGGGAYGARQPQPAPAAGETPNYEEYTTSAPPPKKTTKTYGQAEPAIKHTYDWQTDTWHKQEVDVQLDTEPFQEGTLRVIFFVLDLSLPSGQQACVAKLAKDVKEGREGYFIDVEMQGKAKKLAESFNAYRPPKKIDFVVPWVLEFKRRTDRVGFGRLYMGVEPELTGEYKKHSNNYGFVSPEDRNTPQAFSHFSYIATNREMLVCDIQGVDDIYTDPQIHSANSSGRWGKADLGMDGIRQFFNTHKCNAICEFLKLPVLGAKKPVGLNQGMYGDK